MRKTAESLNSYLKRLRIEKDVSQSSWAEALGVEQSQVSRWEKTGKGEPSVDSLRRLARFLGTTVAAVIGDEKAIYAAPRDPTSEEMAFHILAALKLPKKKLDAIRLILGAKESSLHRALIALRAEVPAREDSESSLG